MYQIGFNTQMPRRINNDDRSSHYPIVMLKAMADTSPKHSDIEKGQDAYFLIPFDEINLQAVLKNLIGLRHKRRERYASTTISEILDRTGPVFDNQFIQKVLCLMDAHIDDDQFGIKEVCEAMGMCRAQIYRKFKLLVGITPHDFQRTYRLQKAKQLLLTTEFNVSEVAYLTGFKNLSHFSRIFAEEFGKNPSSFSG
jgi:AraC-like DNA-binding protein